MYYCVLYVISVFITLFVVTLTCILGQQQNKQCLILYLSGSEVDKREIV